ncbi:dTMP kinase [Saccharophagus sp. K07]|jgi:dTMP kinase|uniref:dTMP kinase n=1 Tax=Saccharophagus sp. K07 TaxID=2283636 RepID=UPI001651D5D8|nr:dTMP kinase [Saccharophagus sp. K07]MBC6904880.1 dTMP kinase [Saccharophagus sp. K07]
MTSGVRPGLFLTVEGVEGVGKTTNMMFIREWLEAVGVPLLCTREPGGTPLAEELRGLLLANRQEPVDPHAELLMIFAARAQHLNRVILPALASGTWVLCDRFTDATYAYQGGGRKLPVAVIEQLENIVQQGRHPDRTLLLDLDVETGLARARNRGGLDRFEQEQRSFFEDVRRAYQQRVKADPERFIVIDASRSLDEVQSQIAAELTKLLADFKSANENGAGQ